MKNKESTVQKSKSPSANSAVQVTARSLRERILSLEEGHFLGSEEELISELAVSRDTLRQAMRLLEHEGLVTIRRGVGGGFFTRKLDIDSVVHTSALYLRVRKATMRDVLAVERTLMVDACRLAANSSDTALRQNLELLLERIAADTVPPASNAQLVDYDVEFVSTVLQMAENPVLELFLRSIYQFGLREASVELPLDPELNEIRRNGLLRIGEAILRKESEVAALMTVKHVDLIEPWLSKRVGTRTLNP